MTMLSWIWDWMQGLQFGGGGGGDGGAAEMRKAEEARQARIQQAQNEINRVFQGGGPTYQQVQTGTTRGTRPATMYTPQRSGGDTGAGPRQSSVMEQGAIYDPRTRSYVMNTETPIYEQRQVAPASEGFGDAFFGKRRQAALDYYMPQLDQQFEDARDKLTYALARADLLRSSVANKDVARLQSDRTLAEADIYGKAAQAESQLRGDVENQRQTLLQQAVAAQDPSLSSNLALTAQKNLVTAAPNFSPVGELFKVGAYGAGQYMQGREAQRLRQLAQGVTGTGTGKTIG